MGKIMDEWDSEEWLQEQELIIVYLSCDYILSNDTKLCV